MNVKTIKVLLVLIVSMALLALGGISARAADGGRYFSQTGHSVLGEFWTYYQSIQDAELVIGLPITEQFPTRDGSGLSVQYFEKARFELHPNQPVGQRVVVTPLGTKLYRAGAPTINQTTPGACRVLNGFGICYEFLTFFDAHGGLGRFGNPLSAFEFQPDGRLVQYFERARFEWHPELKAGQNVMLADLGRLYFNGNEDPGWLKVVPPANNIPERRDPPTSIQVLAFAARAVTLATDTNQINVIVRDQAFKSVAGATGTVTVYLSTGQSQVYPLTTSAGGLAVIPVAFSGQYPGALINVDVKVSYQGFPASTVTSFRIWR